MSRPETIEEAIELWGYRPEMLAEALPYYESDISVYPEKVRVSFKDGKTIIYDTTIVQPHELIQENIRILRKINQQLDEFEKWRRRRRRA